MVAVNKIEVGARANPFEQGHAFGRGDFVPSDMGNAFPGRSWLHFYDLSIDPAKPIDPAAFLAASGYQMHA
jgi:hypothetical protein